MDKSFERIGDLDCLVRKSPESKQSVILLHGYGADAFDLRPLADLLDPEHRLTWIFPQAPLTFSIGWGQEGRAWFPIEERHLIQAANGNGGFDWSQWCDSSLGKASRMLSELVKGVLEFSDSYLLGGFSQGSMVAIDATLEFGLEPEGLCLLSSTLLNEKRWEQLLLERAKPINFYQSHGTDDPVLPFDLAKRLSDLLIRNKWNGKLESFTGGHQIPEKVLYDVKTWIKDLI